MELDGANVLVTGSAKRVGRRTALRLAESGANIAVHYRTSEEEARETAEELRGKGVEATTVQGNLSKIDEVESLVGKSASDLGGLDALVNNASIFVSTPVGETTREEWDSLIDVNLRGPYFCAQEAVERMDGEGKIVNIADWAGFRPYTEYVPYCISKAGVIAMTKGLAKELAPEVNVNAVAPGPVMLPPDYTEEDRERIKRNTPLERIGSPEDIAEGVAFMLEGSDFVTGVTLPIDGGRLL